MSILEYALGARKALADIEKETQENQQRVALFPYALQEAQAKAQADQMKAQVLMADIARRQKIMAEMENNQQQQQLQTAKDGGVLDQFGKSPVPELKSKGSYITRYAEAQRKAGDYEGSFESLKKAADFEKEIAEIGNKQFDLVHKQMEETGQKQFALADAIDQFTQGKADWEKVVTPIARDLSPKLLQEVGLSWDSNGRLIPQNNQVVQALRLKSHEAYTAANRIQEEQHLREYQRQVQKDAQDAEYRKYQERHLAAETERARAGTAMEWEKVKQLREQTTAEDAGMGPEGLKVAAWEALLFGKNPPGMGTASARQRAAVMKERARIGEELNLTPMEMAMLPQDNKVKMKAVDQLTRWGATVSRSAEKLDLDLGVALDYARKVDPTQLQTLNKAILAGKKEFNDPNANAYATAINSVRTEYARLMSGPTSNAMLPVEALKRGNELLSTGVNVEALQEVGKQMRRDAENTKIATRHQIDGLRTSITSLGKEPAFSTKKMPSSEDLEFTAKKHGISVEEVKKRLGVQ